MADPRFMTGAKPTPRHKLLAAKPHIVIYAPPPQAAYVPAKLDPWGNATYGCCVTSEEAFAKACYSPEIFITADMVVAWASRHGYLNGANLLEVMQSMQKDGFQVGSQQYDDGPPTGVDYSNELTLQSAISQGPVKIGIASSCLPSTAGHHQGWEAVGPAHNSGMDHCVGLAGYGTAQWLYQQLGVPLPSALQPAQKGYLLFTWSTIGFVDHPWIMSACGEAWLRNPTTLGVPPLGPAPPTPPIPPIPPVPPGPVPICTYRVPPVKKGRKIVAPVKVDFPGGIVGVFPMPGASPLLAIPVAIQAEKKRRKQ